MSSWRDIVQVHPACELFPSLSPEELKDLGEDIKKNGLTAQLYKHNQTLLDGRNRLDAMELVGYDFERANVPLNLRIIEPPGGQEIDTCRVVENYCGDDPYG